MRPGGAFYAPAGAVTFLGGIWLLLSILFDRPICSILGGSESCSRPLLIDIYISAALFVGGFALILCIWIWRARTRPAPHTIP